MLQLTMLCDISQLSVHVPVIGQRDKEGHPCRINSTTELPKIAHVKYASGDLRVRAFASRNMELGNFY